jgi:hypothetical protein
MDSRRGVPPGRRIHRHREEYLKLTIENLFAVLNTNTSSRGAKKKELLEAHACFTREFLLLFEEHGLIQED